MTENGSKPDLDLSGFVGERISVTIDDYSFTLPVDVSTPLFARLVRALSVLGEAMQGSEQRTPEQVEQADAEIWVLVDEVMKGAQPTPTVPVRELFTSATALKFLGFLAKKFGAVTTSTDSSPSRTSSAVQ